MKINATDRKGYEFGPFRLDVSGRVLLRENHPVPLTPKAFDTLLLLVENGGALVEKDELMRRIWPDTFVEEANLANNISALRKILGEGSLGRQYIETVPRRGYRFVADVRDVIPAPGCHRTESEPHPVESGEGEQETRIVPDGPSPVDPPGHDSSHDSADEKDQTAAGLGLAPALPRTSPLRNYRLAGALILLLLCSGIAGITYILWKRSGVRQATAFQSMKLTRLTSTHNATDAAISPDGKYVAYVVHEAGQQSIWMRQVSTSSNLQILPSSEAEIHWLFFSPDSQYVYYIMSVPNSPASLYQVPALGGAPKKLMADLRSPIDISPDGKKIAIVRIAETGERILITADAFGGGDERKLLSRTLPETLFAPVWSPDGSRIACVSVRVTPEGPLSSLVEVPSQGGAERRITAQEWRRIGRIAWLSDNSGLVASVADQEYGPYQLWQVSLQGGELQRITNDLNNYPTLSVSADANAIVSVQSEIHPSVWVGSGADASGLRQITSGYGTSHDYWGFSWRADGRIFYGSTAGGRQDIWVMDSDGKNQRQLTAESGNNFDPSASPEGRYVVFASNRSGVTKLWRMESDGANPMQLTKAGREDFLPAVSPDGRWVAYSSADYRKLTLWKVSIDGGEPVRLTEKASGWPAFSPDGKLIACWYADDRTHSMGLAVIPAEGGDPVKLFNIPPTVNTWAEIRWTNGGSALAYVDTRGDASNLWEQPLSGGPPHQLTNFKADRIFRFDWSKDGGQLVCSRGVQTNDVVLITEFRKGK
jgi:Tol biopolymer transport system component/DNA-binding winged helix-turn-helix (wHTH) protein